MVAAAPRLHPRLVARARRLAHRPIPIAETWRRVSALARRHGLVRPSYETVRRLVHAERRRRRARDPSTGAVLLDVALRIRPPQALGDHFAGTLPSRARPP